MSSAPSLATFIRDLTAAADRSAPDGLARDVVQRLPAVLANPELLGEAQRAASHDGYRQHVLHVDPAGRFSILSLVWKPGQRTPAHDHISWCVVGVYEGHERETQFARDGDAVVPVSTASYHAGDVTVLLPHEPNIHRVENAGDETAISIHVYGADIRKTRTSIRREYDAAEDAR